MLLLISGYNYKKVYLFIITIYLKYCKKVYLLTVRRKMSKYFDNDEYSTKIACTQ